VAVDSPSNEDEAESDPRKGAMKTASYETTYPEVLRIVERTAFSPTAGSGPGLLPLDPEDRAGQSKWPPPSSPDHP
jgi:hypothetical protein